ncbi:P2X purinoceptor 7 isoform X1 [Tachyglossus aculeatus]|uniref:P2X purinoceptor 7 isoform X1 n=1 Tax=Tachyglossus aculeatus TaxID=9261 RepID=UPI0018F31C32|nr:P2X purinoceptor 7 isoform X1 [Tachyglossus aculeatus]
MPGDCSWRNVCEYETDKVVRIQSVTYGNIKWILHMIVFSYVSFALVKDKLYQQKEPLISSVHTKVKGLAEVKGHRPPKIFDTADYTFSLPGNSFFVLTNFIETYQRQGECPEYPSPRTLCSTDRSCKAGRMDPQSKGIQTGKCVKYDETRKTCEVASWCPVEALRDAPQPALLKSAENFTVLIKNNIDFPAHNYTTRNILPDLNTSCTFHKIQNPQCPIFRLGDILRETGEEFSEVAIKGGIMGIEISWDCNLDRWFHHCRPQYSFRRLDDKTTNESLYPGFNFRYAKYYKEGGIDTRTLIKAYGIRFDILVFGTGGKFDFIQMIIYIGSTLSYFGLATVFIDFLISSYSNECCRTRIYPCCNCCKPCVVNEHYYRKKCELVVEPTSTLKYVSFVDEPHIRMVDKQLLGESLQDAKGENIPRPGTDFTDFTKMRPPLPYQAPAPGHPQELQTLNREEPPASTRESPRWCHCGNCSQSQLPKGNRCLEELCCREKKGPCITTSPLFQELVLSRPTLQFMLFYRDPLMTLDPDGLTRELRHCAYKRYIDWRFGSEDMVDFAILPSCCRWRIRKEFPKPGGQYSGYKSLH